MFDTPTDLTKHDRQIRILLAEMNTLGLMPNADDLPRSGLGAALVYVVPIWENLDMGCSLYPSPARNGDANNIKRPCIPLCVSPCGTTRAVPVSVPDIVEEM